MSSCEHLLESSLNYMQACQCAQSRTEFLGARLIRRPSTGTCDGYQAPTSCFAFMAQVAGQAVPLTKEVTSGIVRPGGKEVARVADKYSDDATRDKVQVRHASGQVL